MYSQFSLKGFHFSHDLFFSVARIVLISLAYGWYKNMIIEELSI